MSSGRPGIQYYGHNNWGLLYLGATPGSKAVDVNQFLHFWGGLVFKLPANTIKGFDGSTATIHYYGGTDTKGTGTTPGPQIENKFTRISPQINIRFKEKLDLQAAYVMGTDENVALVANPAEDYKYNGVGFEGGYMASPKWHIGLHFDSYKSDAEIGSGNPGAGDPVVKFSRVVPAITYVINQNIRFTAYLEKDLLKDRDPSGNYIGDAAKTVDKIYINMRTMF
jgi:hypothetical protein